MIKRLKTAIEYYEAEVRKCETLEILQHLKLRRGHRMSIKLSHYRYTLGVIERTLQLTDDEKAKIREKVLEGIIASKP